MHSPKQFILVAAILGFLSLPGRASILQTWTDPITVSGGGVGIQLVNTATDTGDWITSNGNYTTGLASVPLYFQFILTVNNNNGETGSGGFFTAFQLSMGSPTSSANERLAIGNNNLSASWSGFQSVSGDFNLNANPGVGGANLITPPETATFVMRLNQPTSTAIIWFNPNLSLSEAGQDAGITTTLTGLGIKDTFDSIWLRAGAGTGSTTFSAMSVQNSSPFFAVPEPSTFVLFVSFAGLALISHRRETAG